jgi:uncharacterized membrane protein (UPF0127 family)
MRLFLLLLSLLILVACSENNKQTTPADLGRTLDFTGELTFLNSENESIVSIQIAVADDEDSRRLGLMDVHRLGANEGMLFIFEEEKPLSFWMANTPLPLDIIYVNRALEIVRIYKNTRPFSTQSLPSGAPAIYVVEVNAGFTNQHDIQEGMSIDFQINN